MYATASKLAQINERGPVTSSSGNKGTYLVDNRKKRVTQLKAKNKIHSQLPLTRVTISSTSAPIQRFGFAALAIGAGVLGAAYGAYRYFTRPRRRHGTAEERLANMSNRGERRRQVHGRIPRGRPQSPYGPTTLRSGYGDQSWTQSRRGDYDGETFGSLPSYQSVQGELRDDQLPLLSRRRTRSPRPAGLSPRNRLAGALTHTLVHGSEEDRAPGTSSYFRAVARQYTRSGGQGHHPLSEEMLPARRSAQDQRDLMQGNAQINAQQRDALENDSASSSDSEDEHFVYKH